MSDFDDMEAEASSTPKPTGSLDAVRAMGRTAVALEVDINDLEAKLKVLKVKRYKLLSEEMPAVMDEAGVPLIMIDGVASDPYEVKCAPHYKAAIKADDPEEQRDAAFSWVEEAGGGDIINNTVTVAFPRESAAEAREFAEEIANRFHNQGGVTVRVDKNVPWNRLTKWLREYVEAPPSRDGAKKLPVPLEILNATIGRVVKLSPKPVD